MAVSVAELFATLGLDITQFLTNAQAAKVKFVETAEGMAQPINSIASLFAELTKAVGKPIANSMLEQLKLQGYSAADAVKLALTAIQELREAERSYAAAAKAAAAEAEAAANRNASIQRDSIQRSKEMFDRDKSGWQESLRLQEEVNSRRQKIENDASLRQREIFDRQVSEAVEVQRVETGAAKAREEALKQVAEADKARVRAATEVADGLRRARDEEVRQLRLVSQTMSDVGQVGLMLFAPIVAAEVVAGKSFADFDSAMTKSLSIMGEVTTFQRKEMSDAARQVALETTVSAEKSAAAYYNLASAGLSVSESIKALPVTARFAVAANLDMERSTDLLTKAQIGLGLRIKDDAVANMNNLIRVSDLLVAADQRAVGSAVQFAEALQGKAAAALRIVNKTAEEGVAVLAALSEQGVTGAKAGEYLYRVLRDLESKAVSNSDAFKKLGISVYDGAGNVRDMGDIVIQLQERFKSLSPEQIRAELNFLKFGDRAAAVLQILLGTGERIKELEEQFKSIGGTTEQVANKQMASFNNQMVLLKHSAEDMAISLGEPVIKALRDFLDLAKPAVQVTKDMVREFNALPEGAREGVAAVVMITSGLGLAASAALLAGSRVVRLAADLKALGLATGIMDALSVSIAGIASALAVPITVATVGYLLYKAIVKPEDIATPQLDIIQKIATTLADVKSVKADPSKPSDGPLDDARNSLKNVLRPDESYATAAIAALDKVKVAIKDQRKSLGELGDDWDLDGKKAKAAAADQQKTAKEQDRYYRDAQKVIKDASKDQAEYNRILERTGLDLKDPVYDQWLADLAVMAQRVGVGKESQENLNVAVGHFYDYLDKRVSLDGFISDLETLRDRMDGLSKTELNALFKDGALGAQLMTLTLKGLYSEMLAGTQLTKEQDEAFKRMGIKTQQDMDTLADQARRDYETIFSSGKASADGIETAWVKAQEAAMNAGKNFSALELLVIAEVSLAHENATKKVYSLAKDISKEIDRLARKMASDFVDALGKVFDTSGNTKLEETIKGLNKDLADHAQAWKTAQQEAGNAIDKINSDLSSSLASELASYNSFVADVSAKFDDIARNHYKSQQRIQADAAKSLRDQNTDYRRFVEDINEKIAEAWAKGDGKAVADLQKQLRRRTEDYNTYVSDLQASKAQQLRDDSEAQAKETANLQKELDARVKAHEETDAKLIAKAQEDTAAIQAKLAEDKAAYDQYVKDTTAQILELESQFTSAFERIGNAFKDMLGNFGKDLAKAIATIGIESIFKDLETSIAKKLKSLVFGIPGIGSGETPTQGNGLPGGNNQTGANVGSGEVTDATAPLVAALGVTTAAITAHTAVTQTSIAAQIHSTEENIQAGNVIRPLVEHVDSTMKLLTDVMAVQVGALTAATIASATAHTATAAATVANTAATGINTAVTTTSSGITGVNTGATITNTAVITPNTAAETANSTAVGGGTTAEIANTAAVQANTAAKGVPVGGGSGGGGGGGLPLDPISAVSAVVTAVSSVVANFQFYAMNKSLDIIVKHTLETVNELRNLRSDEWLREGHYMTKLDDMWEESRKIVDLLRIVLQMGGVGSSGGSVSEENQTKINDAIDAIINGRPSTSGQYGAPTIPFTRLDTAYTDLTTAVDRSTAATTTGANALSQFSSAVDRSVQALPSITELTSLIQQGVGVQIVASNQVADSLTNTAKAVDTVGASLTSLGDSITMEAVRQAQNASYFNGTGGKVALTTDQAKKLGIRVVEESDPLNTQRAQAAYSAQPAASYVRPPDPVYVNPITGGVSLSTGGAFTDRDGNPVDFGGNRIPNSLPSYPSTPSWMTERSYGSSFTPTAGAAYGSGKTVNLYVQSQDPDKAVSATMEAFEDRGILFI